MIMAHGLDVRLRLLIPAAENSISGDAFRPSDVLRSRAGQTVEVGNTDAEGRLVLADAISLADEEAPQNMFVFATLTGAARVALGPDVPALFTDDDAFAGDLTARGAAVGDPVWRLPLWAGYDAKLDSQVADMNNIWEAPFAGAIIAALFLRRFVNARAAVCALRHVRLAFGGDRARPQGRRAAGRARLVRRLAKGVCPVSGNGGDTANVNSSARSAASLDARRNVFRPDLAAKALYGKVSAPRYVQGYPAQVVRAAVPLRSRPLAATGFATEALFGEEVTVYEESEGWAWVQLTRDRYVGYVPVDTLSQEIFTPTHRVRALGTFVYPEPDIKSAPLMHLSLNAELNVVAADERFCRLKGGGFVIARHVTERDRVRQGLRGDRRALHRHALSCGADARGLASTAPASCSSVWSRQASHVRVIPTCSRSSSATTFRCATPPKACSAAI